jgi:diaminopropionate ammonia-lyase
MLLNPARAPFTAADRHRLGRAHAAEALALLNSCPAHASTALLDLPEIADKTGVARVVIKAEWSRMGLGSFKALGGAYAVARLIVRRAEAALGRPIAADALTSAPVRQVAAGLTMVCASAGNHGLSVAAGARAFGARAVIYLSDGVSERFALRLQAKGAEVVRAGPSYDGALAQVLDDAVANGWNVITDAAADDHRDTATEVMRGYTVLFDEAAEALEADGGPATHIFLQAGVGGLAAAGAGYLRDRWGEAFRLIVVEPAGAPCVTESLRQGRLVRTPGAGTTLGRLDCEEPSWPAYQLLDHLADGAVLVSDADADQASRRLAALGAPASPCGATGAAGFLGLSEDDRAALGLDAGSRVLLVGSEGLD